MLCHNDICVENMVFRHGKAVALLDFDLAAPGRPLWDLAHVSRFWAPMLDPESAAIAYPAGLDPARRLRMLADAYGLPLGDRVALVDAIRAADEAARAFVAARVQRGERAFLEAFTQQGGWVRWDRKITWFEVTSNRLIGELLA